MKERSGENVMVGQSYNKEEMTKQILDFYNKNGKIVVRDLGRKNNLPNITGIRFFWGSFQNCLKELGIFKDSPNFNREQKSKEQMLDELAKFTKEYLKTHLFLPIQDEIDDCKDISSVSTYIRWFGSIPNAFKLIGYNDDYNHNQMLEDMKNKYIKYCNLYGKTLNSREITKLSRKSDMWSTEAILNNFGTLSNFQKECGFIPTHLGRSISDEEALDLLAKLGEELGHVPLREEVKKCEWTPDVGTYIRRFGSYKNTLKMAGFDSGRIYISKAGVKCNSQYEVKIANALEKHDVPYLKEIKYKKVMPSFEKAYRFDFAIEKNNQKYYIEFFGITGVSTYDVKIKEKQQVCRENSINLISLYPDDIYGKSYDDVYDLIMNKCI